MSDIELIELQPRPFVGIRRKVHTSKLAEFYAEVFPKVMQWIAEKGIEPTSAPMSVWCDMDMETGVADTHAGVFVAGEVEVDGEITTGVTAGGAVLTLTHVGGYDSMGQSWGRVFQHAAESGKTPGAGWEIYVDDPGEVATDELKTEIYLPVSE